MRCQEASWLLVWLTVLTCLSGQKVSAQTAGADRHDEGHDTASVHVQDRLARRNIESLAARSATMKEMLRVLRESPWISVWVRSNDRLRPPWRMGQGRLVVRPDGLYAVLEFDSVQTRLEQLEAVAHELAHVVEIACLAEFPVQNRDDLLRLFSARGEAVVRGRVPRVETGFAREAGRLVVSEVRRPSHAAGLGELAAKYGLGPPCVEPAGPVPSPFERWVPPPAWP